MKGSGRFSVFSLRRSEVSGAKACRWPLHFSGLVWTSWFGRRWLAEAGSSTLVLCQAALQEYRSAAFYTREGSGAHGSGGEHDGTGVTSRPEFLCYNFRKGRASITNDLRDSMPLRSRRGCGYRHSGCEFLGAQA